MFMRSFDLHIWVGTNYAVMCHLPDSSEYIKTIFAGQAECRGFFPWDIWRRQAGRYRRRTCAPPATKAKGPKGV